MEESKQIQLSTKDIILRYGLICGGFSILVVAILYLIDASLLFGYVGYTGVVGMLTIGVLAALKKKTVDGGLISYGDSVTTSLATYSFGQVVYTLFMLLLYFVIDPSLVGRMKSVQIERMDKYQASGAFTKEQYNAAVAGIENIGPQTILFYSIVGLIVVVIIALLIFLLTSIFVKKESPFKNSPA